MKPATPESNREAIEALGSFARTWRNLLGENLLGAYVTGSLSFGAFRPETSDLDVIVVVFEPISASDAEDFAQTTLSQGRSAPACGMEATVVTEASARHPDGAFQLATSSGASWPDAVDFLGDDSGLLVGQTICCQRGIALLGPPPSDVFAPASDLQIASAIEENLQWHRGKIGDPYHDPGGVNSVLNACRAWRWAEERVLDSKDGGAEWALSVHGKSDLIECALAVRRQTRAAALDATGVDELLVRVLAEFRPA